jgi:hypothetical protein
LAEFESNWMLERGRTAPSTNRMPGAEAIRSKTGCVAMYSFTKLGREELRNKSTSGREVKLKD